MNTNLVQVFPRKRVFRLTWIINNICTNHCEYCPPILHNGKNHNYEWSNIKSFIERIIDSNEDISCSISGGEPSVSPFFNDAVDLFYNSKNGVGVTTNGAKPLKWWLNVAPKMEFICFSYHPSFHDDNFYEKALECSKHTKVTVRVMMDVRHWDRAVAMYERCKGNVSVEPVKIFDNKFIGFNSSTANYEKHHLEWFESDKFLSVPSNITKDLFRFKHDGCEFFYQDGTKKRQNATQILTDDNHHFEGWSCAIGLESLFISYDGYVRRGNCRVGGNLFHIDDHQNFPLPQSGIICSQDTCRCEGDILISKFKLEK